MAEPRYGFRDRLDAGFPSQVIVDATEVCNLACIHCPHPEFKRSPRYAARYLDAGLHAKLVEEVRRHGAGRTQYIRYTSNGEPLVHPGIYDMLEEAVVRSGVFVTLTTNGTTMNDKRIARLLASGLHMVDVSLDALTQETYARVRVGGDLETTRRNVLALLEMKRRTGARTRIIVSFVEQPQNAHEASAFEAYWRGQAVDEVVMRRLHSAAGAVIRIADSMRSAQAREARRPCLYPWERISLTPAGQLAFCPQDWTHESVLADYRETTIRELWQSDAYRRLREAHLRNQFGAHAFCGQCPDWRQTRWPGEGRSYADLVRELAGGK